MENGHPNVARARHAGLWSLQLAAVGLVVSACGAEFTAAPSQAHDDAGVPAAGGDGTSGGATGASGGAGGLRGSGGTKNRGGAGGSGGSSGSGGDPGTGGSASDGGATSAGGGVSTGGASGSGGNVGSGGVTSTGGKVGSGGATSMGGVTSMGSGGLIGSGGATTPPPACTPGALECDHTPPRVCTPNGTWQTRAICGPLMASDLANMDASGLPGFNAPGFRCKSLTVCGLSQTCNYFGGDLGSLQSSETTYTDGVTLAVPEALQIYLAGGAASQCMNPDVAIGAGESVILKLATGVSVRVYFPKFSGSSLKLYIREDGATFTDVALTMKARGPG